MERHRCHHRPSGSALLPRDAGRQADAGARRPGPARFADHRILGAWLEIGSSWETRAQLAVPLHFGHNDHRSFVLGRVDAFRPGELELIGVLQRLLVGIDRQVTAPRTRRTPGRWPRAPD